MRNFRVVCRFLTRLVCTTLITSPLFAQSGAGRGVMLSAYITDSATSAGIAGAEVWFQGLARFGRSDSGGHARVADIARGKHVFRVRAMGFVPVDVAMSFQGDTVWVDLSLRKAPPMLRTVTSSAPSTPAYLKDFETRRTLGSGHFLTERQLARDANRTFGDVATTRFPGLKQYADIGGKLLLFSTRGSCGYAPKGLGRDGGGGCFSAKPCLIQVYLDDMMLSEEDLNVVRTWDLAAAEYYDGSQIPAKYRRSGSACGVMLLWSRRY